MRRFYNLSFSRWKKNPGGWATTPADVDLYLIEDRPLRLSNLPTFTLAEGIAADFLENDICWPLCSEGLRRVVDSNKKDCDAIEWIPVDVRAAERTVYHYYVLVVLDRIDVLDRELTRYADNEKTAVISPMIDPRKVGDRTIFSYPDSGGAMVDVIVNDCLVHAIMRAGCTGVDFTPLRVHPTGDPVAHPVRVSDEDKRAFTEHCRNRRQSASQAIREAMQAIKTGQPPRSSPQPKKPAKK